MQDDQYEKSDPKVTQTYTVILLLSRWGDESTGVELVGKDCEGPQYYCNVGDMVLFPSKQHHRTVVPGGNAWRGIKIAFFFGHRM